MFIRQYRHYLLQLHMSLFCTSQFKLQSFITIPVNWCAALEEVCFLPLSIDDGYLIAWVAWTFTMRVSNNTYFALTMMRFAAICLPPSMSPDFIRQNVSPSIISFWSLSVSLPAALFTIVVLISTQGMELNLSC